MTMIKIGSVTRAERTADLLHRAGIAVRVRKLTEVSEGCVHALEIESRLLEEAVRVLKANGIKYSIIREGRR